MTKAFKRRQRRKAARERATQYLGGVSFERPLTQPRARNTGFLEGGPWIPPNDTLYPGDCEVATTSANALRNSGYREERVYTNEGIVPIPNNSEARLTVIEDLLARNLITQDDVVRLVREEDRTLLNL